MEARDTDWESNAKSKWQEGSEKLSQAINSRAGTLSDLTTPLTFVQ